MGYNIVDDNRNGSIFIRLAVDGSQICEIPRELEAIAGQGHPTSSILESIESALCDFLLVIIIVTLHVSPTVFATPLKQWLQTDKLLVVPGNASWFADFSAINCQLHVCKIRY